MYQNCCKKCGSVSLHTEVKDNNTGLYCDDCGAWIKWLRKDELRAFEYANKSRGLRATAKLYDEAFGNNKVIERLCRFIDGIDEVLIVYTITQRQNTTNLFIIMHMPLL